MMARKRHGWLVLMMAAMAACESSIRLEDERVPNQFQSVLKAHKIERAARKAVVARAIELSARSGASIEQRMALKAFISLTDEAVKMLQEIDVEPSEELVGAIADALDGGVPEELILEVIKQAGPSRAPNALDRIHGMLVSGIPADIAFALVLDSALEG